MIRRDEPADDSHGPAWVLISQLAHARLAADLADAWNDARSPLVEPRAAFVEMVRKHDDGWLVWEQRPEVHDGTPRDFMEMPLDESLAIWRRSIAVAATIGPAMGVMVGGHFRYLLNRGLEKHEARHDWPADFEHLAEEFIAEQDELRADYLAARPATSRDQDATAVERGLHLLQLFDFASLWLCCARRTEPQSMTGPDGETYVFTPQSAAEITIDPWPFRPSELPLAVVGRRVPAVKYPSADVLAATPGAAVELTWRLLPAAG